jgi:hypothetical protein
VVALTETGKELWEYSQESSELPYISPDSGRFYVGAMLDIQEPQENLVAVVFGMDSWYQSVLKIFDAEGNTRGALWHPGRMYELESLRDLIVVRAANNDLRQTKLSRDDNKNFSVVFAIEPKHLYGEAPPYFGRAKENKNFRWYYALSDQTVHFTQISPVPEGVMAWTSCGKAFYFSEHGALAKTGIADNHACKEDLKLIQIL